MEEVQTGIGGIANSGSGPQTSNEMIVFGDIHTDPANFRAITRLLPELKKEGYVVFMETVPDSLASLIKETKFSIEHLKAFPNNEIPPVLSPQQHRVLSQYASYKQFPAQAKGFAIQRIRFNEGRLEWLQSRLLMLEKMMELGIETHCVDVDHPENYHVAGGMGQRTRYMLGKIKEITKARDIRKSILIIGVGHVYDIFEDSNDVFVYDRGIVAELKEDEDVRIIKCFMIYSLDSEQTTNALKDIKKCPNFTIQKINLLKLNGDQDVTMSYLRENAIPIGMNFAPGEVYTYRMVVFPSIKNPQLYVQSRRKYIESLNGKCETLETPKSTGGASYLVFSLDSNLLNEEGRREVFSFSRCKLKKTRANHVLEELIKIPSITVETCSVDPGVCLLTYTDTPDKRISNRITNVASVGLVSNLKFTWRMFHLTRTSIFSDLCRVRREEVVRQAEARIADLYANGQIQLAQELNESIENKHWHRAIQIIRGIPEKEMHLVGSERVFKY